MVQAGDSMLEYLGRLQSCAGIADFVSLATRSNMLPSADVSHANLIRESLQ